MGHAAQILLVVACVLFTNLAHAERVNAAHYQDFWLWAAVKPQPVLHQG